MKYPRSPESLFALAVLAFVVCVFLFTFGDFQHYGTDAQLIFWLWLKAAAAILVVCALVAYCARSNLARLHHILLLSFAFGSLGSLLVRGGSLGMQFIRGEVPYPYFQFFHAATYPSFVGHVIPNGFEAAALGGVIWAFAFWQPAAGNSWQGVVQRAAAAVGLFVAFNLAAVVAFDAAILLLTDDPGVGARWLFEGRLTEWKEP